MFCNPFASRGNNHPRCAASHHAMVKALPTKLAAPVQADPVAESAQAASATIGKAGGTLTATAADGTSFRLDIPANSVPDGTEITMTPLSSLTDAVWAGKLVGAVQLAPEGLLLMRGATLTITPKTKVPLANQIALGYTGDGSDLQKIALAPTRPAIEIPLAHFSGAGLGSAHGGAGAPPSTGSATDAYNSQLGGIVNQWRDGNLSDSDMAKAAGMVLDAEYKAIMSGEVPPGLTDDTAAQTAISDLLQWAKAEELLSINPNALGKIAPTLQKLLEGMYTRAQQRCVASHDLTELYKIISIDRSEQLLGLNLHTVTDDLRCAQFRVDFDSTMTLTISGETGAWTLEYIAHPTITFLGVQENGGPVFTGSTTGSYAKVQGTISTSGSWWDMQSGAGTTFTVYNFCVPAANSGCAQPSLVFDIGKPEETSQVLGTDGPVGGPLQTPYWEMGFLALHADQFQQSVGQATFAVPLEPGSGALIASGTFSGSGEWGGGVGVATENTTINVYHTPPAN